MIAIDTSSMIAYLEGGQGPDVNAVAESLERGDAVLPPPVLTELLSDPKIPAKVIARLESIPRLEILEGYWQRAGRLRAKVLARKLRARLADTLIAQNCLDHGVVLVTRDTDFAHFATVAGLRLLG